ncbi:hypothetical protein H9P43_002097 [Blastocladiella emersonii ATCC 22665]|nr:hypothetical protein H9P43_002097 [Blastocladiella emersonii ATCC 22665]
MAIHTLPASEFFRTKLVAGLDFHRNLRIKSVQTRLSSFLNGSTRFHLDVKRFFARYEQLFGTRELALLLESQEKTVMLFRAMCDRRGYLRDPDMVTDLRIREALATYQGSSKGNAVAWSPGSEVYYRELGAELCSGIIDAAERDLDAFLNMLADELTDDFVAQRDYGYPPGNMTWHFRGAVDAELAGLLGHPADFSHPVRLFAVLPKLMARYVARGIVHPKYQPPTIVHSAESVNPVLRVSFETFCRLYIEGEPPLPALPPALGVPTKSIDALIGTKTNPPEAIETITPRDVEQVEAWLQNGVDRGLAAWDTMLSIMYHYVKPQHLWKEQTILINGQLATRKLRWFAGYIAMPDRKTVQIYSYEGGVRPCSGDPDLSPYELLALRARVDEWYAHRGQLGGPVPRDVYEYATATITDFDPRAHEDEGDYEVDYDDSYGDEDDQPISDEEPGAAAAERVTKGEDATSSASVTVPEPRRILDDAFDDVQPLAERMGGLSVESGEPVPAGPASPPAYSIPWLDSDE